MPARRPSASTSLAHNSSSSRAHKSNDSHVLIGMTSTQAHSLLSLGASATPQQKVVQVLVNRLKNKLPSNSGVSLDRLEADTAIQQAIEALVELSHDSLDIIAWALSELLDRLSKQTDPSGYLAIEVLQSQLFILKVLSMTMASRWNHPRPASRSSHNHTSTPDSTTRLPRQASSDHSMSGSTFQEPIPLDDNCARYVLSVMVMLMKQTATPDQPLMLPNRFSDLTFLDFESHSMTYGQTSENGVENPPTPVSDYSRTHTQDPNLRAQSSSNSVRSGKLSLSSTIHIPATKATYEKTHMFLVKSTTPMNNLIAQYAGRVVFQISASNWHVVYLRLRNKIHSLASITSGTLETHDLQLMAHCALDRQRLVQLLNELSSLLVSMGREAQAAIAVPLRSAVWNWITTFPHEFNECIRIRGKTEGAPERVFDLLYSMNMNSANDERVFWPTLTILECTTTDRVSTDFELTLTNKTSRKEMKFGETVVKHATGNTKLSDMALVCLVDICRAATYANPDTETPLRMVAFDVAHEIKHALSSVPTRKPFWESDDEIDVAMYAEALVAVFRFLPEEDALSLFSTCVEPERSEAVKLCAVRACLTLVQEAERVKWQKPLDKLEDIMAPRLRVIFRTSGLRRSEVDQYGNLKRVSSRPKIKRTLPQPLSDREVLLLAMLSLWRTDPVFHIKNITVPGIEEWVETSNKVWDANLDIAVKVSSASCFYLCGVALYNTRTVEEPSNSMMVTFLKFTLPATLFSIATNLLHARGDPEVERLWIVMAHQAIELYVKKTDSPAMKAIQTDPARVAPFALAEIAFLVALTSADSSVSQWAAKGLRFLANAERQPGAPVNQTVSDEDRSKRNPIYEQLGDPRVMVVGRVGHQKRIRKLIRAISYSSAVYVAVWQECYWRWRALAEVIFDSSPDSAEGGDTHALPPSWQEQRFQWQNLTLFLAALGGACVQENQDLTSLIDVIPAHALPDEMRVIQNPVPLVGTFISDLTSLLVVPDTQIRDVARDALGSELSPKLYSKLLKHLDEKIRSFQESVGVELTETSLLFLDQFIAVLKLLVENTHGTMEDVMSIDVSSTMLTLASFMARFTGSGSFRLKTKFCVMCESVCDRTNTLAVRKDSSARHNILDIIIGWIQSTTDAQGDLAVIQNELNMACLRTAVKLLDRLHLRPVDTNTGDDSVHVVSRLFNKYAGALLQALEAYHSDVAASDSVSELGSLHQKMRVSQREAELRELVITGLSHLVSANTESGFKQCLPLAYDEDNRKRAIFAHVFARVISQGTKFDPEDRSASIARHNRLCELVRGSDMVLALTICEICPPSEVDMMISVLLNIFDTRASLMKLIKVMIEREVAATDNEANLFRGNSTCTRFLSAFAKIHGYNYLRSLIQPLVKIMVENSSGYGYELDPTKVSEQEVMRNVRHVEIIASHFLELVSSSLSAIPAMFREICAHIASTVVSVWPDAKFAATGAFIFLRFINPTVATPEKVDLELPKETRATMHKGLMIITKITQSLANNIFFGKEAHMVVLNSFLKANITNVTRFLSDLSKPVPREEQTDEWVGTTTDDTDLIVLHRFFDKHADKIGKELLSLSKPSTEGDASALSGKRAWDGLCALLVDLGPPLEVPRPSALAHQAHPEYVDLVTRYCGRDTRQVEEIFLETGVPLDQPAVFIFQLSKIDVECLDIELLMYHIFKTIAQPEYEDRRFDVILDCTCFTSISEIPLQWLKYCAELIPFDIRSRFATTHVLNPNTLTQRYLRRLYNVTAGTPFCEAVRAYSSVTELKAHVPAEALKELVTPLALEQQPQETFLEATMKMIQPRPIILTVSATHIRITSVKAQLISPNLTCKATEIIHLADISDIYNVATGMDTCEFIIRRCRGGVTEYFSSPARESIVRAIRSAKGRLKEVQAPLTERFSRFSNVPATLLHVGLLSVDINDEELRGAAYDLLGAVCSYLNYDKSPIVASQAGFIPGDPSAFVAQLSEKIAGFAPQLTLDFIPEVGAAMGSMDKTSQRISCIHYLSPWIKNLSLFSNPTSNLYERSGARLRDCIRNLADLAATYPDITTTIQKYIWVEVGKLDPVIIDVVLDELVRTATEGGVGTHRCEAIAHAIASLSSISVRGRIYSKLRKVVCKVFMAQPFNVLSDHPNWNEISTLIRFSLVVAPSSGQAGCDQLYVPEIIHNVTLVAGCGPPLVRKSVYGIIMNLLQALYISRTEESVGPPLLELIKECTTPAKLQLFGLRRETPTSEYTNLDPANDKECLEIQERLTEFLVQVMEVGSGSQGLLNVWRARWMSLITSSAFQVSPAVQTRAFIALGTLATADVDDDFLYQILVAFNTALGKVTEQHTLSVIAMLRCMCKVVPALPKDSRYICLLFWLAVALLQASHPAFYVEATRLLRVTVESIEQRGMFQSESVASFLLKSRAPLEDITSQLDEMLHISFESSFSFSLASVIFKGMRHTGLREAAEAVLRSLLCVTVRAETNSDIQNGFRDSIPSDALGYFLALLPASTTPAAYRRLLDQCKIDDAWLPDAGLDGLEDEHARAPRISPAFLGVTDSTTALFVASFVGTMLTGAQGDDTETEILFALLADIASSFPQTVSLIYDSLQDRIKDVLANASNPSIIRSVSTIFRVALQDTSRQAALRGSSSTLSTVDEGVQGPGRNHLNALDELGMQGLANSFQFIRDLTQATKVVHWIPALVSLIIA
ncbi:putative GTPase-activator protein for Ras-like GTPases [Lyophyllum shimeji]|uniref:GTPase-activator protein for Ras-like GTPases n=1 Tax=Lyophyllum shimeji TaxID=47721 RepID=A0A9P3PEZ4_LYOSH|nr:putative GTPase-activator protein for Ras-like GTPases [Lyophyllum shimeji]